MGSKERKRAKSDDPEETATASAKRKADIEEIEVDVEAPEPPSKRAKRALKKGKTLTKKRDKDGDDDLTKDEPDEAGNKKAERSEHGVWIGNLPFTVTPAELKTWLVSNSGEVITDEAITRIKLPLLKDPSRDKSAKPSNKGFAYVDFADLGSKVAAIALSETDLGGRKLLIKDATSFEGRPKKEPEPAEVTAGAGKNGADGQLQQQGSAFKTAMDASRKIFVGNMSFKTTEDDVWRNFEKCGEIEFVKVATFEDTGKCKGYGWVRFKEPEAAAWAVKGFVKIKEEVETEEDFKDDPDAAPREKQYKTRKWWVNRMLGRELKLELAEDDHVRYKKRFGKDAQQNENGGKKGSKPRSRDDSRGHTRDRPAERGAAEPLKEASDIQVARLTGAVVKPTGTKVTFD